MTSYKQALEWRYATKKYDPHRKVTEEQLGELLDAAHLAPSSFGLQPWKFIVVNDPALRAKLRAAAWEQSPVTDASHFVVFAAKRTLAETDVRAYIDDIARTRKIPVESLKGYEDMMNGSVASRSPEELRIWNQKQVYIALGMFLSAAALARIDATPMEGFDPAQFDSILGLEEEGLTATVIAAVGYRAADDHSAAYKKVRFPLNDVVIKR